MNRRCLNCGETFTAGHALADHLADCYDLVELLTIDATTEAIADD